MTAFRKENSKNSIKIIRISTNLSQNNAAFFGVSREGREKMHYFAKFVLILFVNFVIYLAHRKKWRGVYGSGTLAKKV